MTEFIQKEAQPLQKSTESFAVYKQRLFPLFVLGGCVASLGFYFALATQRPQQAQFSESTQNWEPVLGTFPSSLDRAHREFTFAYKAQEVEGSWRTHLSQKSQRDGHTSLATYVFDEHLHTLFDEKTRKITQTRTYANASVLLKDASGQHMGVDITQQLGLALNRSSSRTVLDTTGGVKSFSWLSKSNPQVRQMLRLVQDVHLFLTPRFKRQPLSVGTSWSYEIDISAHKDARTGVRFEGGCHVSVEFLGMSKGVAVLRQTLVFKSQGAVSLVEASDKVSAIARGTGTGLVWFDVVRGVTTRQRLDLTVHTSDPELKDVHTSTYLFSREELKKL